jgi:hypothetical protein
MQLEQGIGEASAALAGEKWFLAESVSCGAPPTPNQCFSNLSSYRADLVDCGDIRF